MEGRLREHHSGELHRASAEAKAKRIIAQELNRHGWAKADLATHRKNDPLKLEIAARLRRETTLPLKAIAARVPLGTSKTANATLHRFIGRPTVVNWPMPHEEPIPTRASLLARLKDLGDQASRNEFYQLYRLPCLTPLPKPC